MPGVIDSTTSGYYREVGKMATFNDDLSSFNFSTLEAFADKFIAEDMDLLSPPSSSSSSPSRDNGDSEGELPECEISTVDLVNFLEGPDTYLPGLTNCDGDCHTSKRALKPSCRKDPFMGHRDDFPGVTDSPLGSDSILGQCKHYMDDSLHHHPQPIHTGFSAWGHAPNTDDDEPVLFSGTASSVGSPFHDNDDQDNDHDDNDNEDHDTLPDTPMSYAGTVTGDDSDVDIETIPDTPHSDLCGYSSSDASSDLSPSISPTPFHNSSNKISILQRSSSHTSSSSLSSKPLIRFSSCGVSSSVSLAENLMCGRSIAGKKRKHHKDKYSSGSSHSNSYSNYYPSGNSINFHDYAMSPSSCMSTETAQPTILSSSNSSSSKRLYKRKQLNTLDLSDKEKQNHHNQLERNRRQKLADLFIDLRDEVPNISQQSKASKVMILNQATTYIEELKRIHRNQEDVLSKELHKKEVLKNKLRQLEASLSLK